MHTKPNDRRAEVFGDSSVVATSATSRSAPSDANGEPAVEYKAVGLDARRIQTSSHERLSALTTLCKD